MSAPVTVTGEVERVTYENEATGFRVLRLGQVTGDLPGQRQLRVVGIAPNLGPGMRVRATGHLIDDPTHGEQLRADGIVLLVPETLDGIERYLASGILPSVGPALAARIVSVFKDRTLEVLDHEPARLSVVPGIGSRRSLTIHRAWQEHRNESTTMVLLRSHGVSQSLARRILERYGSATSAIIQRHPYRLALEIWGVGFLTADRIAKSLGIGRDDPERITAGILHVVSRQAEAGHTRVAREKLRDEARTLLEAADALIEVGVDQLFARNRLAIEGTYVSDALLAEAERELGRSLSERAEREVSVLPGWEDACREFEMSSGLLLDESQKHALERAAGTGILVITGGPGVGKTTLVRAIISLFSAARRRVVLAAPTGRAANRLTEATGRESKTIHRLLEYEPRSQAFGRTAENPLDADVVLIDESSMVDVLLARALISACSVTTRLILVGDVDQLPSVGPGAFLRDVVDSQKVPVVRLARVFRQAEASLIVKNAHRIREGQRPLAPDSGALSDFFLVERADGQRAALDVVELVRTRIPERFGLDPRRDIQVLAPMHRGVLGTVALNAALQAALNPEGPSLVVRGSAMRVGDKVMQVKNDYEREVFNGDIGWVTRVDPKLRAVSVAFDGRELDYAADELDLLLLAYAISIHKSQGSEYPAVVLPVTTAHFVMLTRNLLYTAVTRAKRLCVLISDPRALRIALGEDRRERRVTGLREYLEGKLSARS